METLTENTKTILKDSIRVILKDFIKLDKKRINELSGESKIDIQKIAFILNSSSSTLDDLICLYDAYKRISEKEKQQITEKRISLK